MHRHVTRIQDVKRSLKTAVRRPPKWLSESQKFLGEHARTPWVISLGSCLRSLSPLSLVPRALPHFHIPRPQTTPTFSMWKCGSGLETRLEPPHFYSAKVVLTDSNFKKVSCAEVKDLLNLDYTKLTVEALPTCSYSRFSSNSTFKVNVH
jgi:hypothetical protein